MYLYLSFDYYPLAAPNFLIQIRLGHPSVSLTQSWTPCLVFHKLLLAYCDTSICPCHSAEKVGLVDVLPLLGQWML